MMNDIRGKGQNQFLIFLKLFVDTIELYTFIAHPAVVSRTIMIILLSDMETWH